MSCAHEEDAVEGETGSASEKVVEDVGMVCPAAENAQTWGVVVEPQVGFAELLEVVDMTGDLLQK